MIVAGAAIVAAGLIVIVAGVAVVAASVVVIAAGDLLDIETGLDSKGGRPSFAGVLGLSLGGRVLVYIGPDRIQRFHYHPVHHGSPAWVRE